MKAMIATPVCVLALAVSVGGALALIDPDPDGIGFYFDTTGDVNCIDAPPFLPVDCWLLITSASSGDGVLGWEAHVDAAGPVFVVSWTACPGMSAPHWPDFACGFTEPLPWQPAIVVLEAELLVTGPGPVHLSVGPYPAPTIPGHPAYATGSDPMEIRPLFPSAGRDGTGAWRPTAVINGTCVVPAGTSSLGGLKPMYR